MVNRKLKILFVSAEVSPFAKTGGLADVAGSLPQALAAAGHDVRIAMPRYRMIKSDMSYTADLPVQLDWKRETCIVRETDFGYDTSDSSRTLKVYFVDNYHYFDRDGLYGHFDDGERFAFFAKAVLEMLPRIGFQPDVIHCNDWHTGPICMLLREKYCRYPFYSRMAAVYTIHNLEYQGHFSRDILKLLDVGEEVFVPEKVEYYGNFNFMKAGLVYADIINTVSQTYAKEIQTPQYGEGLDGLLRERADDLFGIVNGISYDDFDPSRDPRIYKNYSADAPGDKLENKYALQKEMNLPVRDVPVMGLVSRLTGQKGLDLLADAVDSVMQHDVQLIILGSGDEYYENIFKNLKLKYPEKAGVYIGFNAALAQRIYSGSDIFLMPSRFEPCGLGQIISLRYGTIPVVRATGGLADTIIDADTDREHGNGFSFSGFSSSELLDTIERALKLYGNNPDLWNKLVKRALELDFSWKKPAQKYMDLYRLAIERHAGLGGQR